MKRYIRSFAENRQDLHRYLSSRADIIIEHLIKLFLYPDVQEYNHWKQEISSVLNKIPKLKNSNKLPKASFILDSSWMVWEDQFSRIVEVVKEDMEESPKNFSTNKLYDAVDEYFNWIIIELSTCSIVSNLDIYNEIEYLQNKYFSR